MYAWKILGTRALLWSFKTYCKLKVFALDWLAKVLWFSKAVKNVAQLTHLRHHAALQPGLLGVAELDPEYCETSSGGGSARGNYEAAEHTGKVAETST